jgi:hypothetical protein
VQSPKDLINLIKRTLLLEGTDFRLIDGCWLNPLFDELLDVNFFTREFPKDTVIYVNPPYSCIEAFLVRCFILFTYFDLNIVLIIPNDKFENFEFAEDFIRPIVREVPLSFYYFLQPSFTDLIAIKHGESSVGYSDSFR